MDIEPSGHRVWRDKNIRVRGLKPDSEDSGNEILSVKAVDHESLLVHRNGLSSVSLAFRGRGSISHTLGL